MPYIFPRYSGFSGLGKGYSCYFCNLLLDNIVGKNTIFGSWGCCRFAEMEGWWDFIYFIQISFRASSEVCGSEI